MVLSARFAVCRVEVGVVRLRLVLSDQFDLVCGITTFIFHTMNEHGNPICRPMAALSLRAISVLYFSRWWIRRRSPWALPPRKHRRPSEGDEGEGEVGGGARGGGGVRAGGGGAGRA